MTYALRLFSSVVAMIAMIGSVQAQELYPSRTIKLVVPFASGTTTDTVARIVASHLSDALKQPVIVENRAGASGAIGAEFVAKSAPDGYTFLYTTNTTQVSNPYLMKNLRYDPAKDFRPVSHIGSVPFILAVNPSVPVANLTELVAYAKSNPGKISYATANSSGVIMGATLENGTGISMTHVPYKSGPTAIIDVLGGQVSMVFVDFLSGLPHIKSGKLKAIAISGDKRSPLIPDVAPMAETEGLGGFVLNSWAAVFAPAGTPDSHIAIINRELVKFTARKDVIEKYAKDGFTVAGSTPQELGDHVARESIKWKQMIERAGIQPE